MELYLLFNWAVSFFCGCCVGFSVRDDAILVTPFAVAAFLANVAQLCFTH